MGLTVVKLPRTTMPRALAREFAPREIEGFVPRELTVGCGGACLDVVRLFRGRNFHYECKYTPGCRRDLRDFRRPFPERRRWVCSQKPEDAATRA